jgi:hypothetical protein
VLFEAAVDAPLRDDQPHEPGRQTGATERQQGAEEDRLTGAADSPRSRAPVAALLFVVTEVARQDSLPRL